MQKLFGINVCCIWDLNLFCISEQLRVHSTHNTVFYLYVTSRSIVEDCTRLRFAPFNWTYPDMGKHFEVTIVPWCDCERFRRICTCSKRESVTVPIIGTKLMTSYGCHLKKPHLTGQFFLRLNGLPRGLILGLGRRHET